jgi:Protein of unknown function (DUF3300)
MNSALRYLRGSLAAGLVLILLGTAPALMAQQQPPPPAAPTFSAPQLNDLVAPIALYPDPLLSQVLVASTYPLEVVEAQQWLDHNKSLAGADLMNAAKQQNWDPSVQALVAFPDVLAKLNQDVRWTTDLGNAFLAQQSDVMQAVQHMRVLAKANGRLSTTPQQTVTNQTEDGRSAIAIEPANPQVIYVPTYDPAYIWGPPLWGAYPALYYPPFGFGFFPGFNVGLYFGGWGGWGWGGWGWGPNWFGNTVIVNNNFFGRFGFRGNWGAGRGIWAHNPDHRLGVAYPNRQLSSRFGTASRQSALGMGVRNGVHQPYGFNNSGMGRGAQSMAPGTQGFRGAAPGAQNLRGASPERGFQSAPNVQSRPNFQSAPGNSAPRFNASPYRGGGFGGAGRSFGGGGFGGGGFHGGGFGGGGFHGGGGGFHGGGGRR